MKYSILRLPIAVFLGAALCESIEAEGFRILQVNSYSSDWVWVSDQYDGFRQGLGDLDFEYRSVDLDAKNLDATRVAARVKEAAVLIGDWKPDLVFATDDLAQSEVTAKFAGSALPFVYSGVNKEHSDLGFAAAPNVTGVLEREHFASSLALLQRILPGRRLRLAIVIDDDPTWGGVVKRVKAELALRTDAWVVEWLQPTTFAGFKAAMAGLPGRVDAVGMLGVFRFKGEDGQFVDYETVLRWTAENSTLPDFSFWDTRVERGTLCAVTVSGIEQGRIAGRMARSILLDRARPSGIPPQPSTKGRPMISLARARALGLSIDSGVLLDCQVLPYYAWERR